VATIGTSYAQNNCLPDGIKFNRQKQIDSFNFYFPTCVNIIGDVLIEDFENSEITDLSGLAQIINIGGNFTISNNDSLTNLSGLESLLNIKGRLEIKNNPSLLNIAALQNLKNIERGLGIQNNPKLSSLNGNTSGQSVCFFKCRIGFSGRFKQFKICKRQSEDSQ
jgi:hypothetical protein